VGFVVTCGASILAFLALPVIPHLKITDLGMVDVDRFEIMP
jgi:adenine deaminase